MSRTSQRTALYNPSLLRPDELRAAFAARHALLAHLLAELRAGHRHHLLAGPCGAGKTTLLLRLALALEDDEALRARYLPLRFPEEQSNLAQPSDLWINALRALADSPQEAAPAKELEHLLAALHDLGEPARAARSLRALLGWAERADKVLVLFVDNLDLALSRLTDHHWELRELLSRQPRLALIGATAAPLDEARDSEAALYELCQLHPLADLDERESITLLRQLASPRLRALLSEDAARVSSLLATCGGTPRVLRLLHHILEEGRTTCAEEDLEALLDQLTPYYKARFDSLSPQSQLLVDAVALHHRPVTAAECDRQARIGLNATSAVLHRLTKQGILAKRSSSSAHKLTFQLRERLFHLWYLMRAGRARQRHRRGEVAGC